MYMKELEPNAYVCYDCKQVLNIPNNKRSFTMDGRRCEACGGRVIPAHIGIDMANSDEPHNERT